MALKSDEARGQNDLKTTGPKFGAKTARREPKFRLARLSLYGNHNRLRSVTAMEITQIGQVFDHFCANSTRPS